MASSPASITSPIPSPTAEWFTAVVLPFKNVPVKRISEKFNIQFRAEFFNVLNRANFQAPSDTNALFDSSGNSLFAPGGDGAGSLHSTVTDSREIQFALRFVW
jgi:hypothetical protein